MANARIVNVVATGNLGTRIDLIYLASQLVNVDYNPKKFSAAIYRIKEPKATFLLFSSGKFVCCTGCVPYAQNACQQIVKCIQTLYPNEDNISLNEFTIRNIVGTFYTGFQISLESFYNSKRSNCVFEQEFFPGLKFVPIKSEKKTALLFVSGKVIITGCKKEEDVYEMASKLNRMLLYYKRDPYTHIHYPSLYSDNV